MQILFDTSDFPARWHCGNWTSLHGWIHIVADLATAAAYFAIPAILVYFIRKRGDMPFRGVYWLFALFILSCGTVHLVEATIFWVPVYRVSALAKVLTALISIATVVALKRVMPEAVRLPGMAALNEKLQLEVAHRERSEEELRSRNYELDHFAGMASHDLKSPLSAIRHLATWVQEDCQETLSAESSEHLQLLLLRVDRMDDLLNGLLEFTRAGGDAEGERLDLAQEAAAAIELLEVPDECTIEVGELPTIKAPRAAIRLILRNLVGNALKHCHRSDIVVQVRGWIDGQQCILEVEDNGPGIPEEHRDTIFQIFKTVQSGGASSTGGLGLAAVRRAVSALDGSVDLKPTKGGGATFVVTLPVDRTPAPGQE